MNMQTTTVMAPPTPKTVGPMQLPIAMMRDILIKTIFRMNVNMVSEIAKVICLPIPVTQELVDIARRQLLLEATGTLSATSGKKWGISYQIPANPVHWMLSPNPNISARCRFRWTCTANRSNASRSAISP